MDRQIMSDNNNLLRDADTTYMTFRILLIILIFFTACHKIETGDSLSKTDINRIQSLHLLDSNEKIYKFYSEYKTTVAGNFFTNKRMARYWIDERDNLKNEISSAFYSDLQSIDTVYYAGLTYCPYMRVTKKDGRQFKVCVEGKRKEIKSFFEDALNLWTKKRNVK